MPKKTIELTFSKEEIEKALREYYKLPEKAHVYFSIGIEYDPCDPFSMNPGDHVLKDASVSYEE